MIDTLRNVDNGTSIFDGHEPSSANVSVSAFTRARSVDRDRLRQISYTSQPSATDADSMSNSVNHRFCTTPRNQGEIKAKVDPATPNAITAKRRLLSRM